MNILIDCMGGDNAPEAVVAGVKKASKEFGEKITLLGLEQKISPLVRKYGIENAEIINTSDNISAGENALHAIKSKRDSSMVVGLSMLRQGKGDAFVSAGNTGALIGAATLFARRIKGVKRIALSPIMPTKHGATILIDAGANVDYNPEFLAQFAIMGEVYMKKVHDVAEPRIGLLNVGSEDGKGHAAARETFALLKNMPINFVGNIEARDLAEHACDVLVTDGFTGNVLLKTLEGVASMMNFYLKQAINLNPSTKFAGILLKDALTEMQARVDYSQYGGAPVLGANGTVIKAHGSSSPEAFYHAIRQAIAFHKTGVNAEISRVFAS
ncbi:MAG: phosphate acyltransferase PlsX [Clostridiales bacterium]|jgi:glycerol-3-phosphate acyltransferase PlsX|nr:phosphate acyltransferase PlsX [Clostridiales bacterium]